ncbi:MAG: hypothetical protein DRN66_03990 [Candidatus Nanohalarchaeota archaeon]|nr:MAG: hypothetical protein DRN66_03990 [Candidatus Nanohaloarchaeota archaeon]
MVLYKALYDVPELKEEYGNEPLFARPFEMFFENVKINGKKISRFKYIE